MIPTVLIPFHSRRDLLERALSAVAGWPVLLVDDSREGLALDGVEKVRTQGEVGFSRAVNMGLEALEVRGHTHALLLNDDAQPHEGCIEALVDAWTDEDGALAPVLVDEQGMCRSGFVVSALGRVRVRRGGVESPTVVDAVSGAAMLIRTSERLDQGYRHGFEDLDLCRRLQGRGLQVRTIPDARCLHVGGATVSQHSRYAQRTAVAGHLRYLGGGWKSGMAVALSVGQVLRERGHPGRLLGVIDGWRDYCRGHGVSEGPGAAASVSLDRAAAMAESNPGSSKIR